MSLIVSFSLYFFSLFLVTLKNSLCVCFFLIYSFYPPPLYFSLFLYLSFPSSKKLHLCIRKRMCLCVFSIVYLILSLATKQTSLSICFSVLILIKSFSLPPPPLLFSLSLSLHTQKTQKYYVSLCWSYI